MYARYLSIKLFSLCVGFCLGSTHPQPFPPCDDPLDEIVWASKGENVTINFLLYEDNNLRGKYMNAEFSLIPPNRNDMSCQSNGGKNCINKSDKQLHMSVSTNFTILPGVAGFQRLINFKITINPIDLSNSGAYLVQSDKPVCTVVRITITVRDTFPLCSAFLLDGNGNLEFSCRWRLWESEDQMKLMAGNQTLQHYNNCELPSDTNKISMSRNLTTVFGTTIAIPDTFDIDRMPDACIAANSRLDFENQCKFSAFMTPKEIEITEFGQEVLFTCCTNSENVQSIWWYSVNSVASALSANEQFFTVDIDISQQGYGNGNYSEIFLICGGFNRDDMQSSLRIGKINLNLQYQESVVLRGEIASGRSSEIIPEDDEHCTWPHAISISLTKPLEHEHTTIESTSATEPNTFLFGIFDDDPEIAISVISVFAFSILLNVAWCVTRCSKALTSKKSLTIEGNRNRDNSQTYSTWGTSGGWTLDRAALSTESPFLTQSQVTLQTVGDSEHLHDKKQGSRKSNNDSTAKQHGSSKSKRDELSPAKSTGVESGEKLIPTSRQHCGVSERDSSTEDEFTEYQNFNGICGASTSLQMLEGLNSPFDDAGRDFPSPSFSRSSGYSFE